MIQVRLNATVHNIRTDNGTEFVNQTVRAYYDEVGISHQTSVARTPQQNDVVERWNHTLVEASSHSTSGPGPKLLTPGTISSRLVPNITFSTPSTVIAPDTVFQSDNIPPTKIRSRMHYLL
ncbi:integrase, catalytic region, zinc finger, CCHC-type containing protein [Tanacetum coccineum]